MPRKTVAPGNPAQYSPAKLTPEEVARLPLPGMAVPNNLAFSPDDRWITYLYSPEKSLVNQLFVYDTQTGRSELLITPPQGGTTEQTVSREEALRRERQRQYSQGVTQYSWAENANHLIAPIKGSLYACEGPGTPLRLLVEAGEKPILDPQISPDGEQVAYVKDAEIYVIPFSGGVPRQVTDRARQTGKTHGLAEFVAQEEIGRSHGYWWSPDSRQIAFTEVDETHIPKFPILHLGLDGDEQATLEEHRYPFTGQPNAKVRLAILSLEGGEMVWMDLSGYEDGYLARVEWLPDGSLSAQLENRPQNRLELVKFNPASGARQTLLCETNDRYINLNDFFRPLELDNRFAPGGFLWGSERTGFRHLYLYDAKGELIHSLTSGEWVVDALAGIDQKEGKVYFTSSRESSTEMQLYSVSLEGGEPRRLTPEPGMHSVVFDDACHRFVDTHHSLIQPPRVTLRSIENSAILAELEGEPDPRLAELELHPPEIVSLENRSGTRLNGAIYHPPASYGKGPFPVIVNVYGGPHVQLVTNGWNMTVNLRAQYLSSLGYLVFVLDNRGSARRGQAFESAIFWNAGHCEVDDQVDGVHWLVQQGLADPERVGIYGWSYGGYMSAMCLARAPETFKVAVAGAPVTHYDGYDTHYTERYMGTPQSNPQGYEESSVLKHVPGITGKLLIIHGLIDENVHFRHTARLINALNAAHKPYNLLLLPESRHTTRKPGDRVYMEERIRDFFIESL